MTLVALVATSLLSLTPHVRAAPAPVRLLVATAPGANVHSVATRIARATGGRVLHEYTHVMHGFEIAVSPRSVRAVIGADSVYRVVRSLSRVVDAGLDPLETQPARRFAARSCRRRLPG